MADHTISGNLKRLRSAQRLTQEALAGAAGLSLAAYRKIESGVSEPRVRTLQALAGALDARIEDLVAPVRELRAVRFRSQKRLRTRAQILVDVARWLEDFNEVEELLCERARCSLADVARDLPREGDRPRAAAAAVRRAFGLDDEEPVRDICGLLEANGVKVGTRPVASEGFFGLSIAAQDGGPAVVVNTDERISVERRIFTVAHELGHLLLHLADYDVAQTEEPREHEHEANAFAASFLMPEKSFWKEWHETAGIAFVDRILKVKRMFRVSYRTVLYRVAERYGATHNVWQLFQRDYARRFGRTLLREDEPAALARDTVGASFPEGRAVAEPEQLSRSDFAEDRLARLVRKAVESDQISLGRGAEILRLPLKEMRELSAAWIA